MSYEQVPGESPFYAPLKAPSYPAKFDFCVVDSTLQKLAGQKLVLNVVPVTKAGDSVAYSYMPLVGLSPNPTNSRGPHSGANFEYVISTSKPVFIIESVGSGLGDADRPGTKLAVASDKITLNNEREMPSFQLTHTLSGTAKGQEIAIGNNKVRAWSQRAGAVHSCVFKLNFLSADSSSVSGFKVVGSVDLPNDDSCSAGAPLNKVVNVPSIDLDDLTVRTSDKVEIVMSCQSPRVNHEGKAISPLHRTARKLLTISNFND